MEKPQCRNIRNMKNQCNAIPLKVHNSPINELRKTKMGGMADKEFKSILSKLSAETFETE
jgi:hypothetical protein